MQGLTDQEAWGQLQRWGPNVLRLNEAKHTLRILRDVVQEPMFILLCVACGLYFLLGENAEGLMMVAALFFVAAISVYQEVKSANALAALQQLTEPQVRVIRSNAEKTVSIEDLVPGDLVVLEEGEKVPADARVVESNDLSVSEAVLTGESLPVEKSDRPSHNLLYQGTVINAGRCRALVLATGNNTELGKIGQSLVTYNQSKTALQVEIDAFVKRLAFFGFAAFLLIFLLNFLHSRNAAASLLFGLTLAMSAIPEEIPVAFSSFMALGAHALSRLGIITRQPQTIENLGAVSVICLDKTGTVTENRMTVESVYDHSTSTLTKARQLLFGHPAYAVLRAARLASEQQPFDAMEKAICDAFAAAGNEAVECMVKEYPLQGRPPMMTHVYAEGNRYLAAAKGGVERVIAVCRLPEAESAAVLRQAAELAAKGHRVLGVATAVHLCAAFPASQDNFNWRFEGLVSLYDPPKPRVKDVLQRFYNAGIAVKLLTGDYPETAASVAEEIGLKNHQHCMTGDEVMATADEALAQKAEATAVFSRMFPEAKLRVIQAVMRNGNIVAMTGDGVNDGPALKAANIGIALGRRGTEVARQSADIILTDDELDKILEAIRGGRKIFANLKKAVRYIVSIHIPIILVASLPVVLGWKYPNVFSPIHVIFLELIMGPTCSVFFEREPVEPLIMEQPPRRKETRLFDRSEVWLSIVQGLAIAAGVLLLFYLFSREASLPEVRAAVFTTLLLANVLLTFVNRSFVHGLRQTCRYKNNLALPVLLASAGFLLLLHFAPFVQGLFGLAPLSFPAFLACLFTALVSVGWFEVYKSVRGRLQAFAPDHKHAF